MKTKLPICLILCSVFCLTGCLLPRTTVVKNPGPKDKGVRYYRPKPYLLLKPSESKEGYVDVSMQYLPDFEEEYSIRVCTGLGTNETSITLADGWNLTEINQKLDSQVDENIGAVSDLLGSVSGFVKTADGDGRVNMQVPASNVPLGFYESIVSRDHCGIKRLYGWRYVGFHPFNACPMESGGVECTHCTTNSIYALGFKNGVMVFEPVYEMANRTADTIELMPLKTSEDKASEWISADRVATLARTWLNENTVMNLRREQVAAQVSPDKGTLLLAIIGSESELKSAEEAYRSDKSTIDEELKQQARGIHPDIQSIEVNFQSLEPLPEPITE